MSDQREAPAWMAETCELHQGDLRELDAARAAVADCTHVIHLAAIVGGIANFHRLPHTLLEVNNGLYNAVFRAALEEPVERLVYVSSSMVFENATEFPTTESHVHELSRPRDPPTASRSSPARSTAARSTTSTSCRTRSAGPSTPTAPASCRTTSRGSRTPYRT